MYRTSLRYAKTQPKYRLRTGPISAPLPPYRPLGLSIGIPIGGLSAPQSPYRPRGPTGEMERLCILHNFITYYSICMVQYYCIFVKSYANLYYI